MEIRDNPQRSRYELIDGDDVIGFADYVRDNKTLMIPHVEIDARLRGGGYGSTLANGVLEDARAHNLDVVPRCSFMVWYMQRS